MTQPPVHLELSADEALVLAEFFARFEETDVARITHPAEEQALLRLSGQLEKQVVALFAPNYRDLLEAARTRIAGAS